MSLAAISLNFDSLSEAYGFPEGYEDPCFFSVADRFLKFGEKYSFQYSIYLIGRDLEVPARRNAVKEWARKGHEIGNHTWSHPMNLGALSQTKINEEITRSHHLLSEITGKKPVGFISPAWSSSRKVTDTLSELNYAYDTSLHPSWIMFGLVGKGLLNHIGDSRWKYFLNRRDWNAFVLGKREPHFQKNIVALPMPTNRMRMSCWHTLGFVIGWENHFRLLKSCLEHTEYFYYLVHPTDLLDPKEQDPRFKHHLERANISLDEKMFRLEQCLKIVRDSGREIVTMENLAKKARESL